MARPSHTDFPPPVLIATTSGLDEFCQRMSGETFVTVDTEFMRERTYWPELCLVQIAGAKEVAVIDARADGLDLTSIGVLFGNEGVTKVFHAARQDIEIFVLRFGDVPRPIFDTQVAAMVAGFGDQVGYDALVSNLTGSSIDKAHRFSDWSVRPLSAAQIAYAAADVTHLRDVYLRLSQRLEQDNRLGWVAEEMAVLNNPATYRTDPETAWERLRPRTTNRRLLVPPQGGCGMAREGGPACQHPAPAIDQGRGVARNRRHGAGQRGGPGTRARRYPRLRGGPFGYRAAGGSGRRPEGARRRAAHTDAIARVARPSAALVSLLKVLLAAKSEQHHVAPRLVASSKTSIA